MELLIRILAFVGLSGLLASEDITLFTWKWWAIMVLVAIIYVNKR